MFINITASETGNNKASSRNLIHYLEKENRLHKDREPENFFNGTSRQISGIEAANRLDNNVAKLSRNDAKFFLVNVSPSQKELAHLQNLYGNDKENRLKAYAVKVMDEYARNFNRPGINCNTDLLWFAKLERYRYYGPKDKEVKQGLKKRGEPKPGEQLHLQIVVSRKDVTNSIKLSPMNKSRGKNKAHSAKLGQFDRVAFIRSGEHLFDHQFGFERGLKETFDYAKIQKNGDVGERLVSVSQASREPDISRQPGISLPEPASLLEIAFARSFDPAPNAVKRKRRKRKGLEQEQGLTL